MLPVPVCQHGAGPCSFQHTLRFRHGVTAHCSAKVSTPSALEQLSVLLTN